MVVAVLDKWRYLGVWRTESYLRPPGNIKFVRQCMFVLWWLFLLSIYLTTKFRQDVPGQWEAQHLCVRGPVPPLQLGHFRRLQGGQKVIGPFDVIFQSYLFHYFLLISIVDFSGQSSKFAFNAALFLLL